MEKCNNYNYDLKFGEDAENKFAQLVLGNTVEVKRDRAAYRTGNIVVEFHGVYGPTGLATSKADWWLFVLSDKYKDEVSILIKATRLKEIARIHLKKGRVVKMGDGKKTTGVLIPVLELINYKN